MVSEGSCDPEDWSNDAENTALHHRNKLHFNILISTYKKKYLNCNNIHNFDPIDQINAALMSRRLLKKKKFTFW